MSKSHPIKVLDAARYYRSLPHQDKALTQLDELIAEYIPADQLAAVSTLWRSEVQSAPPKPKPDGKPPVSPLLAVPHFSQLANRHRPYATCNITCIAMALRYFGVQGDGSYPHVKLNNVVGNLPDQLYDYAKSKGWEYNLGETWVMRSICEAIGEPLDITNDFTSRGTIPDLIAALREGKVCVLHGWFTTSGHIIVVRGWDEKTQEFIVNDPYGEYHLFGRYNTNVSGQGLRYSLPLIASTCHASSIHDVQGLYHRYAGNKAQAHTEVNSLWLHRIGRAKRD